ncbi:MAG: NTP transferase domain-containing protein [Candidatus Kapabacteria bacterium]|nr:NTP transferase domain-containing protein [Ignavibacteriota bacterium]MCW5883667.1 NTP transferase domain-containing protein [Candidatus Kapabacteria bacterium]
MRAVIPVAGVGTRLRPHTYSLPKVLLNVAGKPILGHILDALLEQSINKATIITGYMGKLVEEYVKERYSAMEFEFVVQEQRLGLGHAIWIGSKSYGNEPLMIILGDTIFDVDLGLAFKSGVNSIGVKAVEDPRRFGVVVKGSDNKITKLIEKPEEPISKLAIVGLYNIQDTELLTNSLNELMDKNIRTRGEYQLTDALQLMIDKGADFTTFPVEGWYDCGKPETLLSTNRFLLDHKPQFPKYKDSVIIPPVFISDSAVIERSVLGPYASIADGAVVKDSIVRNSIVSFNAKVVSSLLEESIIGNDAEVKGHFHKLNVGDSSQISES